MIEEIVILDVIPSKNDLFIEDFKRASEFIRNIEGYINHSLSQSLEESNKYLLKISWETIESHQINFRTSKAYDSWKQILHHYYDPFPKITYFKIIHLNTVNLVFSF